MKKLLLVPMIAALLVLVWAAPTSATSSQEGATAETLCTPIYETQDNPDYAEEYTIDHEEEVKVHEAETKEEGKYRKWVVVRKGSPAVYETVVVVEAQEEESYLKHEYKKQTKTVKTHKTGHPTHLVSDWSWWSPSSTQWSKKDVEVLETGHHGAWKDHPWNYERTYRYAPTGETKKVVTQEAVEEVTERRLVTPEVKQKAEWQYAWGEIGSFSSDWSDTGERRTVKIKDAWTEVINEAWTETVPAQGTPTIEVQVGEECPHAPEVTPAPTPEPDSTGEDVTAVGLCDGTEFVTTTTTESWEEYDGVRTYGDSDTEVTREYDPTCVSDVAPPATPVEAEATFTG